MFDSNAEPSTKPVAPANDLAFEENAALPLEASAEAAASDGLDPSMPTTQTQPVEDLASSTAHAASVTNDDADLSQSTPLASQTKVDSANDFDTKMEEVDPESEAVTAKSKATAPEPASDSLPIQSEPASDDLIKNDPMESKPNGVAELDPASDQVMAGSPLDSAPAQQAEAPNATVSSGTVRPREDDEVDEPMAKRSKIDMNGTSQPESIIPGASEKLGQAPVPAATTNGRATEAAQAKPGKPMYSTSPVTPAQRTGLLDRMKNLKKVKSAVWFLKPVDPVALNIPSYPDIIKQPMDLGTMERKLKENAYASVAEFVSDFELIVGNALQFNGPTHIVTQTAQTMEAYFRKQMESLPRADAPVPAKAVKKHAPPESKASQSRRESRSAAAPAQSPPAGGAFALQPDGTPQIRRDSATNRPSRTIRPPPTREVTYAKPKRKAFQLELKFCEHVLDELRSSKYTIYNIYFLAPVDPVALNIPQYRSIIKHPMDMQTMSQKLKQGQYEKASEFRADFELMVNNCMTFNPPPNAVRDAAVSLKQAFDQMWKDKSRWEKRNQPASQRASSASADESEGDESEEEDEENSAQLAMIAALTKQLADMQKVLATSHPKDGKKKKSKSSGKSSSRKIGSLSSAPIRPKPKVPKKPRQVTYDEKQEISNSVERMNGAQVEVLSKLIMENSEKHRNMADEEMELEIDDLPNDLQLMLLKHVRGIFGAPKQKAMSPDDLAAADDDDFEPERAPRNAGAGKRKKHKPMGKKEQMEQMAALRERIGMFKDGAAVGNSGSESPAHTGVAAQQRDSSGDDESEESESEEE